MITDIIALALSVLQVFDYGYKISRAQDELKKFNDILDNTDKLLKHVRLSFETLAAHLPNENRRRVVSVITCAESALTEARSVAKNSSKKKLWNLRWALGFRDVAAWHRTVISQHHSELVGIETWLGILRELWVMWGNNRFSSGQNWLQHWPMQQIGNTVTITRSGLFKRLHIPSPRNWAPQNLTVKGNHCCSGLVSPSGQPEQKRNLAFPLSAPINRLPAGLDGGHRDADVMLRSWLLRNATRSARGGWRKDCVNVTRVST
jgi:hypothetical protein